MKRPILIATLGIIIGIIGGVYLEMNTVPLFFVGILITMCFLKKNQWRYLKIMIPFTAMILFLISMLFSYGYTKYKEKQYESMIAGETGKIIGTIQSEAVEKEYVVSYRIQIEKLQKAKNILCQLYVKKEKKNTQFCYGEKVQLEGELELPEEARNEGGFSQKQYFQSKGLYGTIYVSKGKIQKVGEASGGILKWGSEIRKSITEKLKTLLSEENANLLLAILIGKKDDLSDEVLEEFRNSSLIHILCVSGAHISFLLLGVQKGLKRLGRNRKYGISLLVVVLLISITGFSASVGRACLMGSLMILGKLCFRKTDTINTIAISLLVLLLYNPFLLFDTGLLLSYGGAIGILSFSRILEEKIPQSCGKVKTYILKTVIVSCSAQILLAPIIAYLFQSIHPTFFISNLVATPIFEAILFLGCFVLILSYLFPPLCFPLASLLNLLLSLFSKIAEISSVLPLSQSKVARPSMVLLIAYYIFIFGGRYVYLLWHQKNILRYGLRKQRETLYKWKKQINRKKIISAIVAVLLVFQSIKIIPGNFHIYFIDVGQGDSTLIQTRNHKTLMIDSGGTEDLETYDVGKKVLVPYLLTRGIKKLDYILISHFHADHCNGFVAILEELQVGAILMAKQEEVNQEAERILNLAKKKNIKIIYLEQGQVFWLDNETKLEILYIGEFSENLNNNSVIAQISYHQFSMLFTGDAEKEEEIEFLKEYEKQNRRVDVLKVGHHGSSTSTTQELLNKVKPSIALIGVGKKNTFGHPKEETLEKLKRAGSKIYRTDQMGEICLEVKRNGSISVKTKIRGEKRNV